MGILRASKGNDCKIGLLAVMALLAMGLTMVCTYASALSPDVKVSFVNYDMETLDGDYPDESVPDGAMLYTAADLGAVDGFQASDGCTWYLYKAAADGEDAFGPAAIPDPPARVGYEFYDWAALNATGADGLHTVQGDTVFLARYARSEQYLVSFYYQYDDDSRSVAAPTTSTVGGLGDPISMALPQLESLDGLTPEICCLYENETAPGVAEAQAAAAQLNAMLQNGSFSTTLNEEFLELCRTAWFVEWDTNSHNYKTDDNGVVRINIPVVYEFDRSTSFEVHYYLQGADDPRSYEPMEQDFERVQISGSTHVSLEELGLVKEYEGFGLNAVSRQYAASYTVNPDGSTVIDLHYDREMYYVTYQLHGGNLREPVGFRFGQSLSARSADLLADPVRAGYDFAGWSIDGTDVTALPETMPAKDLVLEAKWTPAETSITIVYWLENANDEEYTPVKTLTVRDIQTESSIGYEQVKDYLSVGEMEKIGILDGEYFTLVTEGDKAIKPVAAAGDGSTTINAYYDRKEYTLVFHVGWIGNGDYDTTENWYYVSTGGNSSAEGNPTDWISGYFNNPDKRIFGAKNVTLTMNGHVYSISNDTELCYQITDKYGAYIGDRWPVANDTTISQTVTANNKKYQLFTWGTHASSPYFQDRVESGANKNIMGVYSTMSAELIINADDPGVAHHLTAYWAAVSGTDTGSAGNGEYKVHHYLFEAVPGTTGGDLAPEDYQSYSKITSSPDFAAAKEQIAGLQFYESQTLTVRTSHTSAGQNPPAFANLTFQYGCYNGADVYFFYTYHDYTLTYHENNADLTEPNSTAATKTVTFHYVGGHSLADTLADRDFVADYEPEPAHICQYGNEHLFAGWYKDPACTIPIAWETLASESSITAYAKWNSPTFDLTLEIPGGFLSEDVLNDLRDQGCPAELIAVDGDNRTYRISDIPDGTPINQLLSPFQQPDSSYGLDFQDWYETDEDGLPQRFLFDDSQVMSGNRTLTARWVDQKTGAYTIRYLTSANPDNGLEPVEVDGERYYRLQGDETILGLAVGSAVTLEPQFIDGYLPNCGSLTKTIVGSEENPDVFDFIYTPMGNQDVTYTVHFVLDTGENYGRTATDSAIAVSDSTTYTLSAARSRSAAGTITGSIRAVAVPIPGYVPRNGYQASMVLSSLAGENHLYFYYISNADASTDLGLVGGDDTYGVDCHIKYYIWDEVSNTYKLQETTSMKSAVGTILYAAPYAQQYLSQAGTPDLALDQARTAFSVVVSEGGNNTLPIYFTSFADEETPPDTDWSRPEEDLPASQPDYVPTLPPGSTPDSGETGDGETGDGETGDGETGDGETGDGETGDGETGDGETGGGETGGGETGGGETGGSNIPVYYTLHYDSNGGTAYLPERYTANTVVTLNKMPLRAGFLFTGWYADAALTQPITSVVMAASRTVYAGWKPSAVPEMLNGADHFAYIIGYPDGTVRPQALITRAEVAAIFFRLLDPAVRAAALTDSSPFADVPQNAWYNQAVSTLNALGIFRGKTATTFDGGALITRGEFAAVCARFDVGSVTGTHSFTDIQGHWAREEISRAAELGWILGYEDGSFRPDQLITRAEVMSIINRMLHRLPETIDDLLPEMTAWPDNLPGTWYYLTVQEATNTHDYTWKANLYETWTQLSDNPDWSQYQ